MAEANQFSAAGPHYGHMVQETLMFNYLLEAEDDDIVSIEYFDDVGVEKADGNAIAVQSKSALSWNPVSNRAKDFWKTISNWITMVENGQLDPNRTKFVIALAKPKTGQLASLFQATSSTDQFETLCKAIREEFKKEVPGGIATYLDHFWNADRELTKQIAINFDLEAYDDPREAILAKLRKQEEERNVESIFNMMTGWIKDQIEGLILEGKPPFIESSRFRKQIFAARRELDQRFMLKSYATEPSAEEADEHLTRMYVKQLELIDCDVEEKIEAISSYIKSRTDRIRWADEGDVHESSFDEFYKAIQGKWKNGKRKIELVHVDKTPEDRGRLVLYECNMFRQKLGGLEVPSHFTPGCFHDCSDKLKIGWHEDYLNRLGGDNNE